MTRRTATMILATQKKKLMSPMVAPLILKTDALGDEHARRHGVFEGIPFINVFCFFFV